MHREEIKTQLIGFLAGTTAAVNDTGFPDVIVVLLAVTVKVVAVAASANAGAATTAVDPMTAAETTTAIPAKRSERLTLVIPSMS